MAKASPRRRPYSRKGSEPRAASMVAGKVSLREVIRG
jgi:hypothetical protein